MAEIDMKMKRFVRILRKRIKEGELLNLYNLQ